MRENVAADAQAIASPIAHCGSIALIRSPHRGTGRPSLAGQMVCTAARPAVPHRDKASGSLSVRENSRRDGMTGTD